jgi:hypothetical protein
MTLRHAFAVASASVAFSTSAFAVPTQVLHENLQHCDPLFVPQSVDELGTVPGFTPFPDERIDAIATFTNDVACPGDDPNIPNVLVVITNLTGRRFSDLWYVGDFGPLPGGPVGPQTTLSNFDGVVSDIAPIFNPGLAFKIDTFGINRPLVFESIAFDGIFAAGETWHFIIDDYANVFGLPPFAMGSVGVAGASGFSLDSSGSIIAIEVPEPASAAILVLGSGLLLSRRRSRSA